MSVWAYSASWVLAAAGGWFFWRGAQQAVLEGSRRGRAHRGTDPKYGGPRAPAALLSQGLFWIDYFVASAIGAPAVTSNDLGVYAACVRVALAMVLFLTAVSYVFSPFVADLHARGETREARQLVQVDHPLDRRRHGSTPACLMLIVAGRIPAAVRRLELHVRARRRSASS